MLGTRTALPQGLRDLRCRRAPWAGSALPVEGTFVHSATRRNGAHGSRVMPNSDLATEHA